MLASARMGWSCKSASSGVAMSWSGELKSSAELETSSPRQSLRLQALLAMVLSRSASSSAMAMSWSPRRSSSWRRSCSSPKLPQGRCFPSPAGARRLVRLSVHQFSILHWFVFILDILNIRALRSSHCASSSPKGCLDVLSSWIVQ